MRRLGFPTISLLSGATDCLKFFRRAESTSALGKQSSLARGSGGTGVDEDVLVAAAAAAAAAAAVAMRPKPLRCSLATTISWIASLTLRPTLFVREVGGTFLAAERNEAQQVALEKSAMETMHVQQFKAQVSPERQKLDSTRAALQQECQATNAGVTVAESAIAPLTVRPYKLRARSNRPKARPHAFPFRESQRKKRHPVAV